MPGVYLELHETAYFVTARLYVGGELARIRTFWEKGEHLFHELDKLMWSVQ